MNYCSHCGSEIGETQPSQEERDAVTNKAFYDLIERIRVLDPAAADYLADESAWKERDIAPCADLAGVFYWDKSPQGSAYWNSLYRDL